VTEDDEMLEGELDAPDEDGVEEESALGGGTPNFLAGLMVGTVFGISLALLFAPAKGQTTRRRLKRRLGKLRARAEDGAHEFATRARRELDRLER
jgi:hypothetical protein